MDERKNKRTEEILKEEFSKIIYREMDINPGVLVTLTKITLSSDLRSAKAWISILPENSSIETIKKLRKRMPFFQYLLIKKMGVKWVPEINLIEDTTEQKAAVIENLIEENKS